MKRFVSIAVGLPLLLGSCSSSATIFGDNRPREMIYTYTTGKRYCYTRFLDDAPYDRICVKGDFVTYSPSVNAPRDFRPMPGYVTALFEATRPTADGRLSAKGEAVLAEARPRSRR
jgi:hypothetical protein